MNKETSPENTPQEELSIGELLRTEREKKGISKNRLAEVIKVREHVIDALEKEAWDKLPARVFIKGFIRSYTIAIGYDTKKALRLFDKCVPSSRGEDAPVPLTGRRKKSRAVYYAVPILIILAFAVYLFTAKDKVENNTEPAGAVTESSTSAGETGQETGITGQTESVAVTVSGEVETRGTKAAEPKVQEMTLPEPEKKAVINEPPQQIPENKSKKPEKENPPAEKNIESAKDEESIPAEEPVAGAYEEETPSYGTASDEQPASLLTLSAMVLERTYVKIIIDDNPPKEFIFQPGTNLDWTAERGFEVTVGNAAGIEFVFNGETITNIGRAGRVKTLHFPKDFKTNWEEE